MEDVKHTRFIKYIGFLYSITLILCLIFFRNQLAYFNWFFSMVSLGNIVGEWRRLRDKQVNKKLFIGLIMIDMALVVVTIAVYFLIVTHSSKVYNIANIVASIILIIKYPIVYNIIYK
jgi:hypothetical protein